MRKYLIGALIALMIVGLAASAYLIGARKSTQETKDTSSNKLIQVNENNNGLPESTALPKVNINEQVIAAITSKNTQALEGYMADIVQVRLESSGCCGPISKAEAISQLSYLDPATGWDFDPSNPIIVSLTTNVPDYYGTGWLVGVASNEYIVSFKINNLNKIEAYNLGASYKLLLP